MRDVIEVGVVVLVVVGGLALIFAALFAAIRFPVHAYDAHVCASFAQETGRETRLADYSFFEWDCVTPGADGKWISTDALRDVVAQ